MIGILFNTRDKLSKLEITGTGASDKSTVKYYVRPNTSGKCVYSNVGGMYMIMMDNNLCVVLVVFVRRRDQCSQCCSKQLTHTHAVTAGCSREGEQIHVWLSGQ